MCVFRNNMRPRIQLDITWTLDELNEILDNPNSCVHVERSRKHVALHPIHLNNLNKAFHDILGSSINFYEPQFKGLLLAYKHPKLLSQLGAILYDSHFIHVDIEADFYIFRPEVNRILTGEVNKKADNYIGVLVHKVFNVSIPKSEEEEDWEGDNLEVNDDVTFTVVHVDLKGKLPFIRGKLLSSNTSSKRHSGKISTEKRSKVFNSDEECEDGPENPLETSSNADTTAKVSKRLSFFSAIDTDSSDDETLKKSKKHSKSHKTSKNTKENVTEIVNAAQYEEDTFFSTSKVVKSRKSKDKKSKKNSKHKETVIALQNDVAYDVNEESSESTGTQKCLKSSKSSSKGKKPIKREQSSVYNNINDEEDCTLSMNNEIASKKSSIRRHSKLPKKSSKPNRRVEEQINVKNNFNEQERNILSQDSGVEVSSHQSQLLGREEHSKSTKKSSKHKTKIKSEQHDIKHSQNKIETNRFVTNNEVETPSKSLEKEKHSKSKTNKKISKRKERIEIAQREIQNITNEDEGHISSMDSGIEASSVILGTKTYLKLPKKSSKHKKKVKVEQNDEEDNLNEEEYVPLMNNKLEVPGNDRAENISPVGSEMKVYKESGREKQSKSLKKSKRKERIKVEQSDVENISNDSVDIFATSSELESSRNDRSGNVSTHSEIEVFNSTSESQEVFKLPKKSSKLKNRIKKERSAETDSYKKIGQFYESSQDAEQTETQNEEPINVQLDDAINNEEYPKYLQSEAETPTKSSRKKKRGLNNELMSINIKQEPVSDFETSTPRKSKRKRKDRENTESSVDNTENTEERLNVEQDSNQSENQEKEQKQTRNVPITNDAPVGKIRVKPEFKLKEESRKREIKEEPSLRIKRESASTDVEGTAVKKKKTLFTE